MSDVPDEFRIDDDSIDAYMGHLRELIKKSQRLEYGPGGIMEMKQTIADREREIEYLQADIRFWQERYTHYTTTLQAEVDRLQKELDFYLPSV